MRVLHYNAAIFPAAFGFTAVLLEEPELTAAAVSADEALRQLRRALQELHRRRPWMDGPQAEDYQLHWIPVTLRAEHKINKQVVSSETTVEYRFPCAVGEQEGGLKVCVVPSLALHFFYEEGRSLRELVGHYVQENLSASSPGKLLRHAPPTEMELRECRIKTVRPAGPKNSLDRPNLEAVAEPAHQLKLRGYGREKELTEFLLALQAGLSVVLLGPPSVGKTTLLVEAARKLQKSRKLDADGKRQTTQLWRTSAARLVAGMSYLGQWEERCEKVIEEAAMGGTILAVDSVAELIRQGGREPNSSIAAFLTPYILDGQLQLVVEASPSEWQACKRLLPGFADVFRVLPVEAMEEAQTLEVLEWVRVSMTQSRNLTTSPENNTILLSLFQRFSPYAALPGGAARFLRRLGETTPRNGQLTRTRILEEFSKQTGISELFLRDDIPLRSGPGEELTTEIEARVIGQPRAVEAALRIVTAFKAGLNDPQRPLGVLLLCGPTGVGKTELAKTLAQVLFGEEKRMIRLDMSEYASPGSADRLMGSLHEKSPTPWLRQLRQQPFSVVLFDEVEKAHPEVFDVLLRAFDEGHLNDPWGRRTSLLTSVLLLTSNLGAEQQGHMGLTPGKGPSYSQAVYQFFRPELINRLDAVVPFSALTPEVVRQVAEKEMRELEKRPGLKRRGLGLQATPAALDYLARLGYDVRLGARPLQRLIEKQLIPPLAQYLRQHSPVGGKLRIDHQESTGFTISSHQA